MKILFFIDTFRAGGKERRLMELMKALHQQQDLEFELVIFDDKIQYREVFDLGIRIHQIIRKTKKDFSVFKKVYSICKSFNPDLVHCWDSMSAIYLIPSYCLLKFKFVNGMITDAPQKSSAANPAWLRAQITFPFSTVVIGNSIAGLAAYNAPKGKSVLIRNGFNFNRISALVPAEEIRRELGITTKYVVGMVASYSKFKDYKTYFSAAQIILEKRKDVSFLAIGNNTDLDIVKYLFDAKHADHIKLLGRRSNVESYVNAIDVGVLATFTEGISNSIMEYMALGKAVVATNGGGTVELVEEKQTGFLVTQGNAQELSERLEILLDDDVLRNSMGKAGKQRIHELFSISKMVDGYLSNYKKLVKKPIVKRNSAA